MRHDLQAAKRFLGRGLPHLNFGMKFFCSFSIVSTGGNFLARRKIPVPYQCSPLLTEAGQLRDHPTPGTAGMEQRRWLLLALALLLAIPVSEHFRVTAPLTVVGIVGQDTILPCTISSTKPLDNPQVHWIKITDGHTEDIYTYGHFGGEPMQKYRGRTSVPGDGFATGNVSLTLKNVQPADEGRYICSVESSVWFAENDTKLSVAGTGEVFIDVLGYQEKGLELGCRSQGWFPKPTVQWVTEDGQGLSADTEIHQDSRNLFSVWSRVTVTGEQVGKVTCQTLNPLLQVEKKTTLSLSEVARTALPRSPACVAVILRIWLNRRWDVLLQIRMHTPCWHPPWSSICGNTSVSTPPSDKVPGTFPLAGTGEVFIDVLGYQKQGLELGCRSQGWLPKPTVQWVTEDGQGLSADTEIHQDSRNLFSVQSQVTVTGEQVGKVTCQTLNPPVTVEKKTILSLSGDAFPRVSPGLPAFWTVFTLFLLTLAAGAVLVFRGKTEEANISQALESRLEKDLKQLSQQIQTLKQAFQNMQESTERDLLMIRTDLENKRGMTEEGNATMILESTWQKDLQQISHQLQNLQQILHNMQMSTQRDLQVLRTELENKRELSEVESYKGKHRGDDGGDVTLDADTAHPRLEISADGQKVKDTGVIRHVPSNEKRFDSHLFVLAKEGYTSGKHYWEVSVGTRRIWALGIARESVTRKGTLTLCPQNGFWVIACADGQDYWAYTNPWTRLIVTGNLSKIGVFLDIPAKQVSFYDVCKARALYTFSIADGSSQEGKLIPFFSTGLAAAEPDTEPLVIVQFSDDDE
ncbi:butyrophilin subfamily 3 member A1-like isoform X2 [Corvus kubaryi]|uniref:butyrophilin subfamily 3 member A1-like isoform X2 n=1 Tax=Corvus kubaryi TaxID=68294 RepID=UPI001C03F0CD|nr:butyrophilin subfamily 3 member A1-like isoform X2 [Corvus kubaryi]